MPASPFNSPVRPSAQNAGKKKMASKYHGVGAADKQNSKTISKGKGGKKGC